MRYELTDHEWAAIRPMLPNNPRGVPRVNDRRVLTACEAHRHVVV
jgi:transposase